MCGYAAFCLISVAAANIFLGLAVILSIIQWKKEDIKIYFPIHYLRAFIVFFLTMFILTLLSDNFMESINNFFKGFSKLCIFIPILICIKDKSQLRKIFICMLFSIFIADSYLIWQGIHGNARASGFFSNAMYFAGMGVQFLPILFLAAFCSKNKSKWCFTGLIILSSVALLLNGTRGAWAPIVIIIPLLIYFYYKNLKRVISCILLMVILCSSLAAVNPGFYAKIGSYIDMNTVSNKERIYLWTSSWNMFRDHPLIGVGVGRYEHYYKSQYILPEANYRQLGHAHNNIMNLLAETGVIGCASFLFMFASFLFYSLKNWFNDKNISALMFFSATLGLFLQGMTESNFHNSIVITFYYFLFALYLKYTYFVEMDEIIDFGRS